jgi:hypothetical protein
MSGNLSNRQRVWLALEEAFSVCRGKNRAKNLPAGTVGYLIFGNINLGGFTVMDMDFGRAA